ncbi:MAG: DUF6456 domain-containing protein [Pikeienuella sp.]
MRDILDRCSDWAEHAFPDSAETATAGDAALYRAHTEDGAGIRAIARATGRAPSTVSRAVRRVEERRDDPLFDRLLADGGQSDQAAEVGRGSRATATPAAGRATLAVGTAPPKRATIALRRLNEPGAFLMVATGAEKAGIFCAANDHRKPIALLPVDIAADLRRRDWIRLVSRSDNSARYVISEPGRAALKRLLAAEAVDRINGTSADPASPSPFLAQHQIPGARLLVDPETAAEIRQPVNLAESPIGWLARRRGPDGRPFLSPEEVEAGERLRTDFEAAQMGPRVTQDWDAFLTTCDRGTGGRPGRGPADGPSAARDRVSAALSALGPGLADVALRVCCFVEGLESCERRMGWSARSGKVVLKIALGRLVEHYGMIAGQR